MRTLFVGTLPNEERSADAAWSFNDLQAAA
jgi:hypothetical protein